MTTGTITKVAGPLVIAEGMRDANMFDVVRVSEQRLIGEIIEMHGDHIIFVSPCCCIKTGMSFWFYTANPIDVYKRQVYIAVI